MLLVGLKTQTDYRFYTSSSKFAQPFNNEGKTLVLQYSVKHEQSLDCGGGYIKLYPSDLDQKNLYGDSPYLVMFGTSPSSYINLFYTLQAAFKSEAIIMQILSTPSFSFF